MGDIKHVGKNDRIIGETLNVQVGISDASENPNGKNPDKLVLHIGTNDVGMPMLGAVSKTKGLWEITYYFFNNMVPVISCDPLYVSFIMALLAREYLERTLVRMNVVIEKIDEQLAEQRG